MVIAQEIRRDWRVKESLAKTVTDSELESLIFAERTAYSDMSRLFAQALAVKPATVLPTKGAVYPAILSPAEVEHFVTDDYHTSYGHQKGHLIHFNASLDMDSTHELSPEVRTGISLEAFYRSVNNLSRKHKAAPETTRYLDKSDFEWCSVTAKQEAFWSSNSFVEPDAPATIGPRRVYAHHSLIRFIPEQQATALYSAMVTWEKKRRMVLSARLAD